MNTMIEAEKRLLLRLTPDFLATLAEACRVMSGIGTVDYPAVFFVESAFALVGKTPPSGLWRPYDASMTDEDWKAHDEWDRHGRDAWLAQVAAGHIELDIPEDEVRRKTDLLRAVLTGTWKGERE